MITAGIGRAKTKTRGQPAQAAEQTQAAGSLSAPPAPDRPSPTAPRALRWAALLAVIAISSTIVIFRDRLAGLGAYGYPGLFLINVFASATLFLPVPGLALSFAAGSSFSPVLVGLASAAGSALGELTGYLAGFSGRGVIESQERYITVQRWMHRYGLWVVFVLGIIPNPLFDMAGMISGAMRIPVWQFLIACWAGKALKFTLFAYAGAGTMNVLGPWLLNRIGR